MAGLRHEIDTVREHVRIVGQGPVTMTGMVEAFERVADDAHYAPHFSIIFDLRAADYAADLRDGDVLVGVLRRRLKDYQGRLALVVPESLHFLARLYSALAAMGGFSRMQCFTGMTEARAWCGLPADS